MYSSGSYSQDTPSIYPYRLDCGIPAADGLDNSFQSIYLAREVAKQRKGDFALALPTAV
jgi:hypothetical protein